jgi:integrase
MPALRLALHQVSQARNFLDAMRGLFKWAKEAKHVTVDPTIGVRNPKRRKGPGFPVWTEEDAAAYDKRWPFGTKERVWRDVLFYTGLRRGDAVTLGRQHVRDNVATLRTEKSQGEMIVCIPILPILQHRWRCSSAVAPLGDRGRGDVADRVMTRLLGYSPEVVLTIAAGGKRQVRPGGGLAISLDQPRERAYSGPCFRWARIAGQGSLIFSVKFRRAKGRP